MSGLLGMEVEYKVHCTRQWIFEKKFNRAFTYQTKNY
jgi:hypothetical protein